MGTTIKITGKFTPKASYTLGNGTEVIPSDHFSISMRHIKSGINMYAATCYKGSAPYSDGLPDKKNTGQSIGMEVMGHTYNVQMLTVISHGILKQILTNFNTENTIQ